MKIIIYILVFLYILVGCTNSKDSEPVEDIQQPYIVVLKKSDVKTAALKSGQGVTTQSVVRQMMDQLGSRHQLKVQKLFYATVQGGVYQLTKAQALELENDPGVAYVEKDQIIQLQSDVTWGLDRIDQADLPLNQEYNFDSSQDTDVNVYVIDTGVLTRHKDFNGRAKHGVDIVDSDSDATDCNGHGTHVAGTIASSTYGVAKNLIIYGVRVLNCRGSGSYSDVIGGIEWVTTHHKGPSVVNMSLGGPVSKAIDDAVEASIGAGLTYVVAAGNDNSNACKSSPARVSSAITVGSSDQYDSRSTFSNYGECVDVFAPGTDITSLWINSNQSIKTISGTSMAAPHVAGVAALYLAKNPESTPSQVAQALISGAVSGKLTQVGSGSPNLLLNTLFLENKKESKPELKNGISLAELSSDRGKQNHLSLIVPEGASNLNIEISNGTGDADLYVKLNSAPSRFDYDCRPYLVGNIESCAWERPEPGTYYVMLVGYSSYEGLSLKAQYELVESNNKVLQGSLSESGESDEYTYQAQNSLQHIELQGPQDADFDLHLYKLQQGNWELVKSSVHYSSKEQIDFHGQAGEYRVVVQAYSGSGEYELKIDGAN